MYRSIFGTRVSIPSAETPNDIGPPPLVLNESDPWGATRSTIVSDHLQAQVLIDAQRRAITARTWVFGAATAALVLAAIIRGDGLMDRAL